MYVTDSKSSEKMHFFVCWQIKSIEPLSIENEKKVLSELSKGCKRSLKCFLHDLDYDNKLLLDKRRYPMHSNMRNLVLMRRGEKQVAHIFANFVTKSKKLLANICGAKNPWQDIS